MNFELGPANALNLAVGEELVPNDTKLHVNEDKRYVNGQVVAELLRRNGIRLLILASRNQKRQLPGVLEHLINPMRQISEIVNGQLAEQFNIKRTTLCGRPVHQVDSLGAIYLRQPLVGEARHLAQGRAREASFQLD